MKSVPLQTPAGSPWQFFPLAGRTAPKLNPPSQCDNFCSAVTITVLMWCPRISVCPRGWMWQALCKPSGDRCPQWRRSISELLGVCCMAALRNNTVQAWKQVKAPRSHFFFRYDTGQAKSDSPIDWKASALFKIKRGRGEGQAPTKRTFQVAAQWFGYGFVKAGSQERRGDGNFCRGNSLQRAWEVTWHLLYCFPWQLLD